MKFTRMLVVAAFVANAAFVAAWQLEVSTGLRFAEASIQRYVSTHATRPKTKALDYGTLHSVTQLRKYIDNIRTMMAAEEGEKDFEFRFSDRPGVPAKVEEQKEGPDYLETWLEYVRYRAYPKDTVDWLQIQDEARRRDAFAAKKGQTGIQANIWEYVGPTNMQSNNGIYFGPSPNTGRISAVAWDPVPSGFQRIYAGSPSGGLWTSNVLLNNWSCLSTSWPFQAVSSIAIKPDHGNTILAGTGDFAGGRPLGACGIQRSVDGGTSWTEIVAPFGKGLPVSSILFDPDRTNLVLACTGRGGSPDANGRLTGNGRIFRSDNAGASFAQVASPPAAIWSTMAVGAKSATTGRRLYYASALAPNGMLWRSADLGKTWEQLPTPMAAQAYDTVEVACSPTSPNTVYLMAAINRGGGGTTRAIWRSTTGGKPLLSWRVINKVNIDGILQPNPPNPPNTYDLYNWSQANYDTHMTATTYNDGTKDNDVLYVGLIDLAVSRNANADNPMNVTWSFVGNSFQAAGWKIHNDQQCMAIRPGTPSEALVGNDGGLYDMTAVFGTGFHSFDPAMNGALPVTEWYKGDFVSSGGDAWNADRVLGGMQDNQHTARNGANWPNAAPTGDGNGCAIIPVAVGGGTPGDVAYAGGYIDIFNDPGQPAFNGMRYMTVYRTANNWGANTWEPAFFNRTAGTGAPNAALNEPAMFFPPIAAAPDGDEVYVGSSFLYRKTANAGWVRTGRVVAPNPAVLPLTGSALTAISVARSNSSILYTGGFDGQMYRSNNKGANNSWTRVDGNLPARPITGIAIDPTNPNRAVVTLGGNADNRFRVWRCNDTTAANPDWVQINGVQDTAECLPNVQANCAAIDPDLPATHLYVGTDIGFFYSRDGGATWLDGNSGLGLPKVQVTSVKVLGNGPDARIYVSTYGRGAWRVRYGDLP
ncbi:MAG: glycoside hydrolase [Fimbriimonadaceae bacterium]|nr:glycoside hydrolase [Fimbriimonadaceae bacterium]